LATLATLVEVCARLDEEDQAQGRLDGRNRPAEDAP
jgi:hypothetical protein